MKVAAFNNREAYLNDLKKQLDIAYQETKSIAEQITRLRQSKAKEFTELVTKELKSLYDRIDMKAPIEQGMLSSIADKIKDYQPLLGAVLSSLTTFLTTPK